MSQKNTKGQVEGESDESGDNEDTSPTLKKQFVSFSQVKLPDSPGTHILLSQSDFWMKQAGIIKNRYLTQTDTGVCFYKFKKSKLNFNEYYF